MTCHNKKCNTEKCYIYSNLYILGENNFLFSLKVLCILISCKGIPINACSLISYWSLNTYVLLETFDVLTNIWSRKYTVKYINKITINVNMNNKIKNSISIFGTYYGWNTELFITHPNDFPEHENVINHLI